MDDPDATILDFIRAFIAERGYPPTVREISEAVAMTRGTVHRRLRAMQAAEVITFQTQQPRTIRILDAQA